MTHIKKTTNYIFYILILIFICIALFKPGALENWEVYQQKPYGHIKTGTAPLNYYQMPRYRKPYRYPFMFRKSYPVNHLSYLE